jgi:hypothetical protein
MANRDIATLRSVFPVGTGIRHLPNDGDDTVVEIAKAPHRVRRSPSGRGEDVRRTLTKRPRPDIVIADFMSESAREVAREAGVGWADDAGNAEITSRSVVVSRTGLRPPAPTSRRWSPSVLGIAEALLDGTPATVEAVAQGTGLSVGTATNGLRSLTELGLLRRDAARGRNSARHVGDARQLLDAYATAAGLRPPKFNVETGAVWHDPISDATALARRFRGAGTDAAVTGALAAATLAPFSMTIAPLVMYVDVSTPAELHGACREAGLRVVDGGRLRLAPFPTPCTSALTDSFDGLPVVPWARAYVDVMATGVRGDEVAEHLAEVSLARLTTDE